MKAQLLIATGELAGKVLYLAAGQNLGVGRTFNNDVALNDPGVSREHAVFSYDGLLLTVKDLKSRNGIFVNQEKVDAAILQSGDKVTIGSTVFEASTDVSEAQVIEAPPSEMPLEGIRSADAEADAAGSDAHLVAVTGRPQVFDEATAESIPPGVSAMAAQMQFIESHTQCMQCGRMLGRREMETGAAVKVEGYWVCPDCVRPEIGRVIGQYRIIALIADGKTGRVFKAEHVTIKRVVAIKILLERLASKESVKLRFLREARAGAQLNHPNIVNMFDAGEDKGAYYLVMEHVEGPNLQKLLDSEGAIAPARALPIAAQVARALEYAHGKGIVHRDVRPANILIAPGDRAKLFDIGTAQWIEATGVGSLTQPGVAFGDFSYLAPELLKTGVPADSLVDVFSLGATLYTMLTGKPPFQARSIGEAIQLIKSGSVPPPSFANPGVPEALDGLIARLMSLDPAQRAPSAAALADELTEIHARLFAPQGGPRSPTGAEEDEADASRAPSEAQADMRLARDIQSKLVPARIPNLTGYDVAKVYRPAKDVGGDYLDFFPIEKERYAVIIADVSGKGVSGAMVMMMVRSVFKMVSLLNRRPAETIIQANKILAKDIKKGMFVSLIYGILDTSRQVLHFANAGHNLPVYYTTRKRKVMLLRSPGMVLGINTSHIFHSTIEEFAVRFEPGDKLVLYTDGVNEAKDDDGQDFGNENMMAIIRASSEGDSDHVVRTLMEGIAAHRGGAQQSDDITILSIGRLPD